MKKNGFVNAESMFAQKMNIDEIKNVLAQSNNTLFYLGGAMEGAYPDLCKELYAWAPTGAPTLAIEVLGKVQFDLYCPGMSFPPQTSEVAKASYMHIQSLADSWAAR